MSEPHDEGAEILAEAPRLLAAGLGPYRRRDYQRLPDRDRCELILGRLYEYPAASKAHHAAVAGTWRYLHSLARTTGGRAYRGPTDVVLAEHSVVKPDAFYLVAERRDLFVSGSECVPDLVVEVLAAETARRDRREKLSLYAELGVHEYWLIDPELSILEVLANDHGRMVVTLPAGGRYPSPGLAGLILDLAELWREIERHWLSP